MITNIVYHNEALDVLRSLADETIDMIYTDPPFGTQVRQVLTRKKGTEVLSKIGYDDTYDDYLGFMIPHLDEFKRVLKPTGTMYLHLDWRWSHYVKVILDEKFGRDCFVNEVIWSYNFGGRAKDCWPKKHDNILVYSKEAGKHIFNYDDVDRIPYKAPDLQRINRTPAEASARIERGQVPTDVWEMSIVGTNSRERTGYPSQKPLKLVERAIVASSPVGGVILDPFAGSGTVGEASYVNGRSFILNDLSPWSQETMKDRFKHIAVEWREVEHL